jgi:hypothetical protein
MTPCNRSIPALPHRCNNGPPERNTVKQSEAASGRARVRRLPSSSRTARARRRTSAVRASDLRGAAHLSEAEDFGGTHQKIDAHSRPVQSSDPPWPFSRPIFVQCTAKPHHFTQFFSFPRVARIGTCYEAYFGRKLRSCPGTKPKQSGFDFLDWIHRIIGGAVKWHQ